MDFFSNDILILKTLLYFSCFLAPRVSYLLFFKSSANYSKIHLLSFILIVAGEFLEKNYLILLWPLFCLYGLYSVLIKLNIKNLNWMEASQLVPFFFSMVAATWLVSGTLDLKLLGYNQVWSFLAAAHGNFLGWMLLSFFSYLALNLSQFNKIFAIGSFLSGACFLLIALGINGMPYVKLIGVFSLIVITFSLLVLFFLTLKNSLLTSKLFLVLGVLTLFFTFALSLLNEFSVPLFDYNLYTSNMILIHGGLNALVVIPSIFLSVYLRFK